jgi:hypothetical protein
MPTADQFRSELRSRLRAAEQAGESYIDVNAGDLHRKVGGYPTPMPRMPNCCSVMRQEQRSGDTVVSVKPSDGASFTIRYQLPR